jgi:hypothetical protein
MHFFSGKSKASGLGTTLQKCRIIRISELSNIGLKEFCCICVLMYYLTKITQTSICRQKLYQLYWSYVGMSNTVFYNRLLSMNRAFMKITPWSRCLLEKVNSSSATQKTSHFVCLRTFTEAEDSLPRYQKTTIPPNSEPHESSLHPLTIFLKIKFDITFPTNHRSSKRRFPFRFSDQHLLCISGPYNLFYEKTNSVHIISEAYTCHHKHQFQYLKPYKSSRSVTSKRYTELTFVTWS